MRSRFFLFCSKQIKSLFLITVDKGLRKHCWLEEKQVLYWKQSDEGLVEEKMGRGGLRYSTYPVSEI